MNLAPKSFLCLFFLPSIAIGQLSFEQKLAEARQLYELDYSDRTKFLSRMDLISEEYADSLTTCPYNYLFNKNLGAYYFNAVQNDSISLHLQKDVVLTQQLECLNEYSKEVAVTYFNIGLAFTYLGKQDEAEKNFDKVIDIELNLDHSHDESTKHFTWIGNFHQNKGDLEKGITYYNKAKGAYKGDKNDYQYRDLLVKLANAERDNENYPEAASLYSTALDITRKLFDDHPVHLVDCLGLLSFAQLKMNQLDQARVNIEEAIIQSKKVNSIEQEILSRSILSQILVAEKRPHKALKELYRVDALLNTTGYPRKFKEVSANQEAKADILYELGEIDASLELYQKGLMLIDPELSANPRHNPVISSNRIVDEGYMRRQLGLKARALLKKGKTESDKIFLSSCIDAVEKYDTLNRRSLLEGWDEKSHLNLLKDTRRFYHSGIEASLQLFQMEADNKYLFKAYSIISKLKGQLLSRGINLEKKKKRHIDNLVLEQEKSFKDSIQQKNQQFLSYSNNQDLQAAKIYNEILDYRLKLQIFQKENGLSDLLDQTDFQEIPSLMEIQEFLSEHEAIFENYLFEDELFTFIIDKKGLRFFRSELDKKKLIEQYGHISSGDKFSIKVFPKTVKNYLTQSQITKLIIVPDNELLQIPYELLSLPDNTLWIDRFEISYAYNLDFINESNVSFKGTEVTGFGSDYNPVRFEHYSKMNGTLNKLNYAVEEIDIAIDIMGGVAHINKDATKENFKRHSNSNNILHFALHGKLNHDFPDRSALIFESEKGDNELSSEEIYNMSIPSPLTILSACNSGVGPIFVGDGVRSMTRSFLHSGSESVITSLWESSDNSTNKILKSFYEYLESGKRKSESLRLAKLDYITKASPTFRHPKYWAHLVLIGNSDALIASKIIPYSFFLILIILVILFFFVRFKNQ